LRVNISINAADTAFAWERLPLPLIAIKVIPRQAFEKQFTIASGSRREECLSPSLPGNALAGNGQMIAFHPEFDGISETALFDQRLWNPDSPGIANTYELYPH
jgi:hypothetical protein